MAPAPDRLDRPFSDPLARQLFPKLVTGAEWELGRMRRALDVLGNPHRRLLSLHVGGTNGKGSVASTLHSVLRRADRKVGLYTSPQLCYFRERYIIDGVPVPDEALVAAADRVRPAIEAEGLTFFEAATVLAFHLFVEAEVDVLVAEVGLGGRLDATNVLEPLVTGVTNVALDHAEYLGHDLSGIAREKAGIFKPGVPAVVAEANPELVGIFEQIADERGAPFHALDPERDVEELEVARAHTLFTMPRTAWGRIRLGTPLTGRHQAANAALAVAMLERLPPHLRPQPADVVHGVSQVRWPGRDQVETVDGLAWLMDVAHNTAGIASLVDTVDRLDLPRPYVALIGVLGDKDWRAMLPPLLSRCEAAWLTLPELGPPERRWDPHEARRALGSGSPPAPFPLRVETDFRRAMKGARVEAGKGTVIVTGSVYTVGSALLALGRPPFAPRG